MITNRHCCRIGLAGVLLLTTSLPAQSQKPDDHAIARKARRILKKCGPDEARFASLPDRNWHSVQGALARHQALRQTLGARLPTADTMVRIYAAGGHHGTTQFSIVLTRDAAGAWHGSAVGREQSWALGSNWITMAPRDWELSEDKARALDRMLADRCLYAEPASFHGDGAPSIGALGMDIDIVTPQHSRMSGNFGDELKGLTQRIDEIATPTP